MDCYQPVCEKEEITQMKNKKKVIEFDDEQDQSQCPLSRNTLGLYSWSLFHTMAIYYPDNPDLKQQELMKQFISGIAEFYPCNVCKSHFAKEIIEDPPKVESREALSTWFCVRHNEVNKWLKKPQFDCSFENLEKRWKTGCQ